VMVGWGDWVTVAGGGEGVTMVAGGVEFLRGTSNCGVGR
jgi:hypothetical protein